MDLGSLLGGLADDEQGKGESSDQLSDLLGSLLGGAQGAQPQPGSPQGGDEVLGSLSGGIGNAPMMGQGNTSGGAPAGGDMGDLLGSLLGGAGGQGGGDAMGDLLGSLLGSGGQMGGQANDPVSGMLGGLLGGLMGGGAAAGSGAGNMGGMDAALAPLAHSLADKLGIPREMATAALAIVVPMIMSKLMNSGGGGDPLGGAGSRPQQGLSFTRAEQDEMVHQLTAQTGMDEQSARTTLNGAVQVLGGG